MNNFNDIAAREDIASTRPSNVSSAGDEWLRLPKPGHRLEGLSRTTLNELAIPCAVNGYRPPVRSILIKRRGAARGIRLINRQSLYEYLQHLADDQAPEMDGAAAEEVSE